MLDNPIMSSVPDKPIQSDGAEHEDTLTFDEDGDLRLFVGTGPSQNMLVDSRVLCRASPVFRKMLRGQFAEGRPDNGDWNVTLPEDNKTAFAVLMDMTHGLYRRTREKISHDELYNLCVLTNKYDMTSVLRPMATRWFQDLIDEVEGIQSDSSRNMMFVTWELGYETDLEAMVSDIFRNCPTDVHGNFVNDDGIPPETLTPFDSFSILDHIVQHRASELSFCKTVCREFTDRAFQGKAS